MSVTSDPLPVCNLLASYGLFIVHKPQLPCQASLLSAIEHPYPGEYLARSLETHVTEACTFQTCFNALHQRKRPAQIMPASTMHDAPCLPVEYRTATAQLLSLFLC